MHDLAMIEVKSMSGHIDEIIHKSCIHMTLDWTKNIQNASLCNALLFQVGTYVTQDTYQVRNCVGPG